MLRHGPRAPTYPGRGCPLRGHLPTIQSRFLLRPCPLLNEIILGAPDEGESGREAPWWKLRHPVPGS
ncbi:MAG TPA: hypothetical protein VGG03_01855 [Thermoanaerobaculia bacterium]